MNEHRKQNLEYYRTYDRGREHQPKRVAKRKEYAARMRERRKIERGYDNERAYDWRMRNPEKHAAHKAVQAALASGHIAKPPQCRCGAGRIQAHHRDYSRPLDVRWLCHDCHAKEHVIERAVARGEAEFLELPSDQDRRGDVFLPREIREWCERKAAGFKLITKEEDWPTMIKSISGWPVPLPIWLVFDSTVATDRAAWDRMRIFLESSFQDAQGCLFWRKWPSVIPVSGGWLATAICWLQDHVTIKAIVNGTFSVTCDGRLLLTRDTAAKSPNRSNGGAHTSGNSR